MKCKINRVYKVCNIFIFPFSNIMSFIISKPSCSFSNIFNIFTINIFPNTIT